MDEQEGEILLYLSYLFLLERFEEPAVHMSVEDTLINEKESPNNQETTNFIMLGL